ncbi:VanZ family protein [Planococcus sp. CAU13]|uniref:VanZ family protein n=1 Tax=Planococcus sp. CAU13 TaxID=1541197 RepID=UPI00068B5F84|nr:VanZ family protein [Planococcus sp. CAU13]
MKNKLMAWLAVAFWMALIFMLSHQPGSVSSGLSDGVSKIFLDFAGDFLPGSTELFHTFVRKNAHFFAYLILAVLLVNALGNWGRLTGRALLAAFAIAVAYAITDEFHQLFIEGRSGELRDVLIDSFGAAAGIAISRMSGFIVQKRQEKICPEKQCIDTQIK